MRSMRELRPGIGKRLAAAGLPTLAVVALFLVSGLASASPAMLALPGTASGPSSSSVSPLPSAAPPALTGPSGSTSTPAIAPNALVAAPAAPVASGRGVFFNNSPMPFPTWGNQTCFYGSTSYCSNTSNDPSINLTSKGVLAVAYTDYTNASPCANATAYAQSEIGFSESTNGGSTWSTPIHLGDENCTTAPLYASAWDPSLTSLANGTLAMAFIAFNLTPYNYLPYTYEGQYGYYNVQSAALLFTESYDNGVTWTAPSVLNATHNVGLNNTSWTPERPWISAFGNTIYVTWSNFTQQPCAYYYCGTTTGSDGVHLLVSTNGGSTWGAQIDLQNTLNALNQSMGFNSFAMTDPSGNLYIAYDTNWTFWMTYPVGCTLCAYDVWTTDVELAKSSNNGSTFAYSVIDHQVLGVDYRWGFFDPSPQLARNPANGQIYGTWSATQLQTVCTISGYCYTGYEEEDYFTNSSTGGSTWSASHLLSDQLVSPGGEQVYNPSMAVTSDGTIHLETVWINQSASPCCDQWEVYLNSTDNGTTFSIPITVDGNATSIPYAPDGVYATMVAAGSQYWMAWSHEVYNGAPGSYYYFPYQGYMVSQVTVSNPFVGPGVTLTFQEKGLKAGIPWSVDMMGNVREGNAPTSLVVSGAPPTENLSWNVSSVSAGYGTQFFPNGSVNSPWTFAASTTVYENYSEQVLVNITTIPDIPSCALYYSQFCWNNTLWSNMNYNITPGPQSYWVPVNHSFSESVVPAKFYCNYPYCFFFLLNMTFLSWTGTGAGSVNSTAYNITFVARGPMNETANFLVQQSCYYDSYASPPLQCWSYNQTLLFHETGLPSGVDWNVSVFGDFGNVTATSNSSWLVINSPATIGVVDYAVWTIPTGTAGQYWIGSGSPGSPVQAPGQRVVNITFTRGSLSSAHFYTSFQAAGLPNDTAWTLDLGSTAYGVDQAYYNTSLAGGSYTVGADPIYLDNGTAYYLTRVSTETLQMNQSSVWTNTSTVPASVSLKGASVLVLTFAPEYWANVVAGTGGNATPQSGWVHYGAALQLNAVASPGYAFVGWTGMGSGSVTSKLTNPVAHPTGPITELATFQELPPPTWTVNVSATGLPSGMGFSATIGNQTISGTGTLSITGLSTGTYPVSFAYAYDNASNSTRYAPVGWTSSFTSPGAGTIAVAGDGTVNVSFQTQYLLTVAATGSGTVAPAPGVGWWASGSTVSLTAVPDPHYQLAGWFGTGPGSVSTMNASELQISPTISGPTTETAQFVWKPTSPPETFNLTVTASGLPSGERWNVTAGATGVQGSGASLMIPGLNGTYRVSLAPIVISAGVRYVPANTTYQVDVTNNSALSVAFTEQFYLTVQNATGGTITPASGWYDSGAQVSLSATAANSTWQFLYWNGTGTGSYTGNVSNGAITMSSPITESAVFEPVYPARTTGSSTDGLTMSIALFVVLLAVALVVGMLLGRRRAAPPAAPVEETPGGEEYVEGEAGPEETVASDSPPEYDEAQQP